MTSLELAKMLVFSKIELKTVFLHFWHVEFSVYDLCILVLCFWSHWVAVRLPIPEQQPEQRKTGHAGFCLPSQLKEMDGSLPPAALGFNLQSPP